MYYIEIIKIIMFENLLQDQDEPSSQQENIQLNQTGVKHYDKETKQLSLRKQNLEMGELKQVVFGHCSFLRSLILCKCNIGLEGVCLIISTNWPELHQLHLSENHIGDEGVRAICKADWPVLQTLNIGANFIRNEGMRLLSLGDWRKIQKLSTYYNQQTPLGVYQIAKLNCTELEVVYGWMGYLPDNVQEGIQSAMDGVKICL